jgi:transcriptional regulator with XRE-family HTH domain
MSTNTGKVSASLAPLAHRATAVVLREVGAAGLSYETVASRLGVSRALIRAWEDGRAHVPLALLASDALSSERRRRIATTLIEHETATVPLDGARRVVLRTALEVLGAAVAANDNAVTDLATYRSVAALRDACDRYLHALPIEARRAA